MLLSVTKMYYNQDLKCPIASTKTAKVLETVPIVFKGPFKTIPFQKKKRKIKMFYWLLVTFEKVTEQL